MSQTLQPMICRACRAPGRSTDVVLDLGPQPAAHQVPHRSDPLPDPTHSLAMWCCAGCGLAQLVRDDTGEQETQGTEPLALREQARRALADLQAARLLPGTGRVREFPSPHGGGWIAELAGLGIDLVPVEDQPADLVLDSFGLMHEADQRAAIKRRAAALSPTGVAVLQFHSLGAILGQRQWNVLRHGHYAYYSLTALSALLRQAGLVVVRVLRYGLYGGTDVVVVRHADSGQTDSGQTDFEHSDHGSAGLHPVHPSVADVLAEEAEQGLSDPDRLRVLQQAARDSATALSDYLRARAAEGCRVYGYGAASRVPAALYRAGIGPGLLAAVADVAESKQNLALPGTRIPIISPAELVAADPDEVLVFLPDLVPELLTSWPQLSGRLIGYDPGENAVGRPDRLVTRFTSSQRWEERLHDLVPGGAHTYARGSDQYPYGMAPVLVRGRGALTWDVDNNCFVEYGIGLRSVTLGHAHPRVDAAVRRALNGGTNFSRPIRDEAELAEAFLAGVPGAETIKFAKNGSDVTTAAVKLARAATGKSLIAICDQAFFSVDDWFITHTPMDSGIAADQRRAGLRFDFNDIDGLTALVLDHRDQLAAVIMQPATATAQPAPGYLAAVRALCDRYGIVLIFDEIITGFRWARGGVQSLQGVVPDLSCWAKGLANGYPMSALTGRSALMELGGLRTDRARVFLASTTYGPERVGLAALAAVLAEYDRPPEADPVVNMAAGGSRLAAGVEQVVSAAGLKHYVGTAGHPAALVFWTLDADRRPSQPMRTVFLRGLLTHGVLGQAFVTSAAHDDALIDHTIDAVRATLPDYARALEDGPQAVLGGPPVAPSLRRFADPRRRPSRPVTPNS